MASERKQVGEASPPEDSRPRSPVDPVQGAASAGQASAGYSGRESPVPPSDAASRVSDSMFAWRSGDPSLILLVDDDPRIRASLPRVLRCWGWECITASDGLDALERILHTPEIGLVISDVDMPRLSGPGLIDWLVHRRPDLPAILISGCELDEAQRARIPMDVPLMQKPVAHEALREHLQRMLFPNPGGEA